MQLCEYPDYLVFHSEWPSVLFTHFITTGQGKNYKWIEQKYINCISPRNFPRRILMLFLYCMLCEILQYAHNVLSTVAKQLCILFHKLSLCIRSIRKISNHSSACFPYCSTASLFITSHNSISPHLHFTQINPRAPSKPQSSTATPPVTTLRSQVLSRLGFDFTMLGHRSLIASYIYLNNSKQIALSLLN